jgi:raffinose/stachyose/melibiose transport system permease protein
VAQARVASSADAAASAELASAGIRIPRARRRRGWRRRVELGAFLGPALLVYATFVIVPVGMALYYSFFNWNGLGAIDRFIGLDNYKRAFEDSVFRGAIEHNLTIAALSVVLQLPIGLALALLLNRRMPGRSVLRLILFAPYVLSEVITAVAWSLLLQPGGGVDHIMKTLGLGRFVQLWLGDPHIVLYTIFAVVTWKYVGFGIILFLAGLQGVPQELTEAAAIDGANNWQIVRHITFPLLGPTIRIWIFLSIIGSLQLFDIVWIMTLGGPAGASETMAVYIIDNGFKSSEFGYGSAVAVILFLMCFTFALIYQRLVLRRDTDGALTRMAGG